MVQALLRASLTLRGDVFAEVQARKVDFGIIPVENSSNGTVDMTLDGLADPYHESTTISVRDETELPIHHCLLGKKFPDQKDEQESIPPNHNALGSDTLEAAPAEQALKWGGITDVYSHPQALGQCQKFLATHLKHAKLHESPSTSEAALIVSKLATPTAAAIASKMAGQTFGLDILSSQIQDGKDNFTRFLILANAVGSPQIRSPPTESLKSLVSFRVKHKEPGALADALSVFKTHSVNLVSINSRPSRDEPWHYIFIVEIVAVGTAGEAEHASSQAINDLTSKTHRLRQLGSWWLKSNA